MPRLGAVALTLALVAAVHATIEGLVHGHLLVRAWGSAAPFAVAGCAFGVLPLLMVLRRGDATAATLRLGVVVLVAWWLGYALLLQPFARITVEVSLGLAAAAYGVLCCVLPPLARALPRPVVRFVDALAFTLCVSALLLEGSLKTLARLRPSPLLSVPGAGVGERLHAHRFAPGARWMGSPCNSLGFFDDEFLPRARRSRPLAVFVGDSFGFGSVPHARNFTTVAERRLGGLDVYNLSVPAIGPDEYQHLLEVHGLPLEPDVVVVGLFAGNDLAEVATHSAFDRRLSTWLDRHSVLLLEVPLRLLTIHGAEPGEVVHGVGGDELPWLDDPALEPPTFSRAAYLELAAERARLVCDPPRERLQALFRRLDRLRAVVAPVPLRFVLIPSEFQVEDGLWAEVWAALGGGARLRRDAFQQEVKAFLVQRQVPVLDLLPVLRAQPAEADGDRHLYLLQDTHWNARGNRVAGEALAEFVRPWSRR